MGEETYFKLRMATPMKRVFNTYADRKGVCVTTLRFLLNGERVGCDDTPATLQLGHHGQIDCLREQPGPQDWPFPRTATTVGAREWSQPGAIRQLPQAESEDEEATAQAEVDLPRDTPDRSMETFTSIQASLEAAESYGGVAQDKQGARDELLPPKVTPADDAAHVFFCRAASSGEGGRLKRVEAEKMSEGSRQQPTGGPVLRYCSGKKVHLLTSIGFLVVVVVVVSDDTAARKVRWASRRFRAIPTCMRVVGAFEKL
ncbi:unnamed protein product [Ectocarpus sp. 12 AP-2014]